MSDFRSVIEIPPDAAIAVTDGGCGRRGSGCGMVFLHAGTVHLRGAHLPGNQEPWNAEVEGVRMAVGMAVSLGLRRLRLLLDHHHLAMFVQGCPPTEMGEKHEVIARTMAAAATAGLAVSARIVQGHVETVDLPSRLNDIAHIVSDLSVRMPFEGTMPFEPGWIDALVGRDNRFRPTRTGPRWACHLTRLRCAHFLGVDPETVDVLVRAGHLELGAEGVRRRSAAQVYVKVQELKLDAFFGFDEPEGVPGRWDDEIHRGWDGRRSRWYHRKSGLRPPSDDESGLEGTDVPSEPQDIPLAY